MIPPRRTTLLALAVASLAAQTIQCARNLDAVDLGPSPEAGADSDGTESGEESAAPPSDGGSPNADAPVQGDARPPTLDSGPPSLVWPDAGGSPNSDPGLVTNHDKIVQLRPNVMVLDYFNPLTRAEAIAIAQGRIQAISESSRYHGYADPNAPTVLDYVLYKFVDLRDPQPAASAYQSSTLLPVGAGGAFDLSQLFTPSYAAYYAVPDPTGSSPYLTLCQLFEQGYINELWLMTGDEGTNRRPPLFLEKKQAYDSNFNAKPNVFVSTGVTPWPDATTPYCKVTTRIAYVSPLTAIPCDLISYSTGIENMAVITDALGSVAIPYFGLNAVDFFNSDFKNRYLSSFNSWLELVSLGSAAWCQSSSTACISYPSDTVAQGTQPSPDGGLLPWTFPAFHQGCGTAHFPPNATYEFDWNNTSAVASRCEHYDLRDGPDSGDAVNYYSWTNSSVATYTQRYGGDAGAQCGGGWQLYLRQNMPGLNNTAYAADGSRMKNWWPFLFY